METKKVGMQLPPLHWCCGIDVAVDVAGDTQPEKRRKKGYTRRRPWQLSPLTFGALHRKLHSTASWRGLFRGFRGLILVNSTTDRTRNWFYDFASSAGEMERTRSRHGL